MYKATKVARFNSSKKDLEVPVLTVKRTKKRNDKENKVETKRKG